jgi:hypothetical protein
MTSLGAGILSACGGSGPADNAADRLEEAAGQSTPEAANVLDNAAEQVREGNVANPDAAVQNAMQAAGNAQAAGRGGQAAPQTPPRPVGAKPHAPGDPVPPPKLAPGQGVPGGKAPTGEEG